MPRQKDEGKAIGIALAASGWFLVSEDDPRERAPIAAWVLREGWTKTENGSSVRFHDVTPVVPTSSGWSGEVTPSESKLNRVVYEPEWTDAAYYLRFRLHRALEAVQAARELATDSDPIQPLLSDALDALSFGGELMSNKKRPDPPDSDQYMRGVTDG